MGLHEPIGLGKAFSVSEQRNFLEAPSISLVIVSLIFSATDVDKQCSSMANRPVSISCKRFT